MTPPKSHPAFLNASTVLLAVFCLSDRCDICAEQRLNNLAFSDDGAEKNDDDDDDDNGDDDDDTDDDDPL